MNPSDNWRSPQTVIALCAMAIVAGTVAAVFWRGDAATVNQTVGTVLGTLAGGVAGFYFGSSAGSQRKDAPPLKETA